MGSQRLSHSAEFLPGHVVEAIAGTMQKMLSRGGEMGAVLRYIQEQRGKMVRPALVILCTRLCGGECTPKTIETAAAIELIHTASLIHDDIIDSSELRRGREAVHTLFGRRRAVLAGDHLFSAAFLAFSSHDEPQILSIVTRAICEMCEGELDQVHSPPCTEAEYWDYIHKKTASLISAACETGALLAPGDTARPPGSRGSLRHFGTCLGRAFQLIDDILDYSGRTEAMGKPRGNDLQENTWTLPLIRARDRGLLRGEIGDYPPRELASRIRNSGILGEVQREALLLIERSCRILDRFPPCEARGRLREMAEYIVDRDR